MEVLKELEKLGNPDPRVLLFSIFDKTLNGYRKYTLKDFHYTAANLKLNSSIPDDIQSLLGIALNLWVYSWFYYPFNSEAGFVAFRALENALKQSLGLQKKKPGLRIMLREAIERGMLKEEGFTREEVPKEYRETIEKEIGEPFEEAPDTFMVDLPDMLTRARNSYAHGDLNIHNLGILDIRFVIEAVNQLFPL